MQVARAAAWSDSESGADNLLCLCSPELGLLRTTVKELLGLAVSHWVKWRAEPQGATGHGLYSALSLANCIVVNSGKNAGLRIRRPLLLEQVLPTCDIGKSPSPLHTCISPFFPEKLNSPKIYIQNREMATILVPAGSQDISSHI